MGSKIKDGQFGGGEEESAERAYTDAERRVLLKAMPVAQGVLRILRDREGIGQKDLDAARKAVRGESIEELVAQLAGVDEAAARKTPERYTAVGEEILARFNKMLEAESRR